MNMKIPRTGMHVIAVGSIALNLTLAACSNGDSVIPVSSGGSTLSTKNQVLTHQGRWIIDAQGRVIVIHGMNYVKKWPTTLPDNSQTLDPAADGFGDNDLKWLEDNGFNGLRLGIEFYGVEPQLGLYDDTYIAQVVTIAKLALAHGVRPLIDFHQDLYSPVFGGGGNGFAQWMVQDDGLPYQPNLGFPYSQFTMPAMLRAWDHFWANDPASDSIGLQDHAAAAAAHVATKFAGLDGLLGYESLNEPWPGSQWPTCVVPQGCPQFDAVLTTFNRRLASAVNTADSRHLIFAEPNVMFNNGVATYVGALNLPNAGFSFHVYCLIGGSDSNTAEPGSAQFCPTFEERAFGYADAHVAQTHEALLMSEFGATADAGVVSRVTATADAHMVSWMWWAYSPRIGLDIAADPPDEKLNPVIAELLIRAYPQAIAGTPTSWAFDPAAHSFTLNYSTQHVDGSGNFGPDQVTEIFLPPRHYPNGYTVGITDGEVRSAPNATLLQIAALPGAKQVTVNVVPHSH